MQIYTAQENSTLRDVTSRPSLTDIKASIHLLHTDWDGVSRTGILTLIDRIAK
jgi:hypothetical protein